VKVTDERSRTCTHRPGVEYGILRIESHFLSEAHKCEVNFSNDGRVLIRMLAYKRGSPTSYVKHIRNEIVHEKGITVTAETPKRTIKLLQTTSNVTLELFSGGFKESSSGSFSTWLNISDQISDGKGFGIGL
jgi:hypothetical protein